MARLPFGPEIIHIIGTNGRAWREAGTLVELLMPIVSSGLMKGRSLLLTGLSLVALASGQTRPEPTFEVASVKPWTFVPGGGTGFRVEPGRVYCSNCLLVLMLNKAYGVPTLRIIGPKWLLDFQGGPTFYQLDARFPLGTSGTLVPAMMRQMLAERFHLLAHVESRDTPVYALRVATGGLKMKPKEIASAQNDASAPAPKAILGGLDTRTGVVKLHGDMTLTSLAESLRADREVIDETGIAGEFEVLLTARIPALPQFAPSLQVNSQLDDSDPAVQNVPSIFSEIQKLGLRLEPTRAPLDYLVIERMDRIPTPN